jgi:gamma-glutamylcyclotransferase (GGCT)/AIG2-like uncharacterized protein YtfP
MKELLFVYGDLKKAENQIKILGRQVASEEDILEGWKKTKIMANANVFSTAIRADNAVIFGKVLPLDIDELDKVEDFLRDYQKQRINLKSGKSAWIFFK